MGRALSIILIWNSETFLQKLCLSCLIKVKFLKGLILSLFPFLDHLLRVLFEASDPLVGLLLDLQLEAGPVAVHDALILLSFNLIESYIVLRDGGDDEEEDELGLSGANWRNSGEGEGDAHLLELIRVVISGLVVGGTIQPVAVNRSIFCRVLGHEK